MGRARIQRSAREILLTGGAVLGTLCLLLGLAAVTLGVDVLVFRSGSMAPTIHTSDLALSRTVSAAELREDDVVSVLDSGGSRVTHRVVTVAEQGDHRQLTLRGDANERPDQEVYTVTEAQRVVMVVPKAGYLVAWTTGPVGMLLLGGYGAFLLSVLVRGKGRGDGGPPPPPRRRAPPERRAPRGSRRRAAPVLLAVVLGGAVAAAPTSAWAAPWTDSVPVTGGTFTAYAVPPPATFTCGNVGVLSVTFNWTAVAGATNYTLHYGSGGATTVNVTGTSETITSAVSGGTAWVVANRNFGSTTWTSVASNTRTYTVAAISFCG
jgi:signal peptidase I